MKITKITLENFRAFDAPLVVALPDGQNLLLHGENGSGKSSIYLALRRFFENRKSDITAYKNKFADLAHASHVTLQFTGLAQPIDWNASDGHPIPVPADPARSPVSVAAREALADAARRAGFIDYRMLLRTHLFAAPLSRLKSGAREYDAVLGARAQGLAEQFFDVAAWSIVSGVRATVAGGREPTLGELIRDVWEHPPISRRAAHLAAANAFTARFNGAFNGKLPELQARLAEFLAYFSDNQLQITFREVKLAWEKSGPSITGAELVPDIVFRGQAIPDYNQFLNEARLSALGVCLFFAGVAVSDVNPNDDSHPRFVFIDDALIGLDYQHRIPILNILNSEVFKHFQKFLLTHDRVWFDLARAYLPANKWVYQELAANEADGLFAPQLKASKQDLEAARDHLAHRDLKAAAVYTRSAFELKLRRVAEGLSLTVPYKTDAKHVSADTLWNAVKAEQRRRSRLRPALTDLVGGALERDIELVRSNVLNRLSHAGVSTLVPAEVDMAIRTIEAMYTQISEERL